MKRTCENCGGNGNYLTDCSICKRNPEIQDYWIPLSRLKEYKEKQPKGIRRPKISREGLSG
jgi:hypothetical protein